MAIDNIRHIHTEYWGIFRPNRKCEPDENPVNFALFASKKKR